MTREEGVPLLLLPSRAQRRPPLLCPIWGRSPTPSFWLHHTRHHQKEPPQLFVIGILGCGSVWPYTTTPGS